MAISEKQVTYVHDCILNMRHRFRLEQIKQLTYVSSELFSIQFLFENAFIRDASKRKLKKYALYKITHN